MSSIFSLKQFSFKVYFILILITLLFNQKFFYAISISIKNKNIIDDTTILVMGTACFCFFLGILIVFVVNRFNSYVLNHFFLLSFLLANTITFSYYDPFFEDIGTTIEIFLLFFVLAMLSKLFSIYPVFSRSTRLNNFLKFNSILIVTLFILALAVNVIMQRSESVLFSFIMLITVCAILLISVCYVIFSILKNSHGQIRRELYLILASLLLSVLPMFTLNLFLHFFNNSIPYYYLLPTLFIFPLYLLFSFCKFKIIVSETFLSIVFSLFQIWNVLMLCSIIVFYVFYLPHPDLIKVIIVHSLLLVLCAAIYYLKDRWEVKHRTANVSSNMNENIYDTLIHNNIKLSNFYLFIESVDQSEQYRFPIGTFNFDDIMAELHMIYERSTLAINQLQDITIYVHRSKDNNAFIALHNSDVEKFKYDEFVNTLAQFDFFMKNYSTKLMFEDYQNRIYLSHAALEEERERLSMFLHDEILQNIILALNESKTVNTDKDRAHLEEILDESIYAIREACEDLFPADLDDFGLNESLNSLIRRQLYESIIDIQFDYRESNVIIDKLIKISSYRMIKELINNAIKHSDAKHIKVSVTESRDSLSFTVSDDGRGIKYYNVSDILMHGSNNGLKYLINQVNLFNGEVEFSVLNPELHNKGLVVKVTLPLE